MNATPPPTSRAHSADVRIHLHVNGQILPVAQLGPDFLILRAPVDHPPAEAELAVSIDGDEKRAPIRLVDGIAVGTWKTRITRPQPTQAAPHASAASLLPQLAAQLEQVD